VESPWELVGSDQSFPLVIVQEVFLFLSRVEDSQTGITSGPCGEGEPVFGVVFEDVVGDQWGEPGG